MNDILNEQNQTKEVGINPIIADKTVVERLAQFVLNRSTENVRNELYEYLIIGAIYDANRELTKEEIIFGIEKELNVSRLPPALVDVALGKLTSNKNIETIQSQGKTKYFLSPNTKDKFFRMIQEHKRLVSAVESNLIELVVGSYGPLTDAEKETVLKNFHALLGMIFSTNGFITANAILGKKEATEIMNLTDVSTLITKVLERKDKLSEIQKEVFLNYLYSPDESLSDYLYSLAQSYYIIEILNLDPECQVLIKENLSKITGYLDTNILVFLVTNSKSSDTAKKLIKLSTDLGIKIKFTKRTKEEFVRHIEHKKMVYSRKGEVAFKDYSKVAQILEDGFLKDYFEKKKENPTLTYDGYFTRLTGIEALLKNKYSIEFDENPYEEIKTRKDMDKVKGLVTKYASLKPDKVAEHDAYHILLIQDLRKKEKSGVLGPNSWFITHDNSLYFVDRDLTREEPDRIPSSIHVENWIQMMSPLLSPEISNKEAKEVFTTLFASRIPVLTKTVKEEDLLELQGAWIDDEDLGPEDLAAVIGDHYVKKCLGKLREARERGEEEKISEIITSVIARVQKKMKQQSGARIERKIKEMEAKYGDRIKTLEETVKRFKFNRTLLILGLICFGLFLVFGLMATFLKLVVPDGVFWGLTVLTLIFVLSSFFGSKALKAIPFSK